MKSHPKTHEADIMVGEGLHGLHPAHVRPPVEAVGTIVKMNAKHSRVQNHEGNAGGNDRKDKTLRK
jgi:hypothetical protein